MKKLISLLMNIFAAVIFAQETTYSTYEEKMLQYVNNQAAYARKYDSLNIIRDALDSSNKFLSTYPHSFARPGVFAYMLQMTAEITKEKKEIFPLIDSVLAYDHIPSTKYGIAEMLIEKEIDLKKGKALLVEAYPQLRVTYHKYKSNILFARLAISDGNKLSAQTYFERALTEDSSRSEGWYEFASYLKYSEQTEELSRVLNKIRVLEKNNLLKYESSSVNSPNIKKSVTDLMFNDLNNIPVDFSKFLGEPFVIQNFNFWCGVPKAEMRVLKKLTTEYPKTKIIFVNCGDQKEELLNRYLNKPEYKFLKNNLIVFDDSNMFYQRIVGQTARAIYIVDENGKISAEYHGYNEKTEDILRKQLKLLNVKKKIKRTV